MPTWGEILPKLEKIAGAKIMNEPETKSSDPVVITNELRGYGAQIQIPFHLLEPLHMKDCFKDLIILEAINSFATMYVNYTCASRELFEEVPQGEEYPRYVYKTCPNDKTRWMLVKAEGPHDGNDFSFLYDEYEKYEA